MFARRCALALLLALPSAAEDAFWSGAAPASSFTGDAPVDDDHPAMTKSGHVSQSDAPAAPSVLRKGGIREVQRVLMKPAPSDSKKSDSDSDSDHEGDIDASASSATAADAINEMAHPRDMAMETTGSRLTSGWVLVLLILAVAAAAVLTVHAFFSRGKKNLNTRRKRGTATTEDDVDSALEVEVPNAMASPESSVVATVAAPLPAYYQLHELPAFTAPAMSVPAPMYAAPVMMAAPAFSTAAAPAYHTPYAMAPAAMVAPVAAMAPAALQPAAAPAMMPFEAAGVQQPMMPPSEPLPVPREPLPVA